MNESRVIAERKDTSSLASLWEEILGPKCSSWDLSGGLKRPSIDPVSSQPMNEDNTDVL